MKARFLVSFILMIFLAGPAVTFGQDANQKKIERIQRKIEKQTKKLQELTGNEHFVMGYPIPPIKVEDLARIKVEAREVAEEARVHADEARAQAEEVRAHVRESMDQQREVMEQQREAMREQRRVIEETEIVNKDINGKKFRYYYKTPGIKIGDPESHAFITEGDVKVTVPEIWAEATNVYGFNQDNLSIDKTLTDETSSADFNYEVREGANAISVRVDGAIDAGKVKIIIKQPNGEVYNEYTLSSLANVNWKQTISFEGKDEASYIGKWTVSVSADKAKGKYSVNLSGR